MDCKESASKGQMSLEGVWKNPISEHPIAESGSCLEKPNLTVTAAKS